MICNCLCICITMHNIHSYRIEQNFGGKKFWRNYDFEILAEKTLANPRLACIFVLYREFWRKKLGELWRFAKFAKVFSPPKFCSIRYNLLPAITYVCFQTIA